MGCQEERKETPTVDKANSLIPYFPRTYEESQALLQAHRESSSVKVFRGAKLKVADSLAPGCNKATALVSN